MHTETEAKTKWCPFRGGGQVSEDQTHCLASGCMAWRWAKDSVWQYRDGIILITDRKPQDYTMRGGGWVRRGFCGLSGKPE